MKKPKFTAKLKFFRVKSTGPAYALTAEQARALCDDLEDGRKTLERTWSIIRESGSEMPLPVYNDLAATYGRQEERLRDLRADYVVSKAFLILGPSYEEMKEGMSEFLNECIHVESSARIASVNAVSNRKPTTHRLDTGARLYASQCTVNLSTNNNNSAFAGAQNFQVHEMQAFDYTIVEQIQTSNSNNSSGKKLPTATDEKMAPNFPQCSETDKSATSVESGNPPSEPGGSTSEPIDITSESGPTDTTQPNYVYATFASVEYLRSEQQSWQGSTTSLNSFHTCREFFMEFEGPLVNTSEAPTEGGNFTAT